MPRIDMPLEQLKVYQGINPRPDDFDAYWSRAIKEMEEVDAQVELVPAEFQTSFAECFHLYFTGVRGARIHAKFLRPRAHDDKKPAVLKFHGYSGNSGDWQDKLGYVAAGYAVAAMDCRGQGGLSEDSGGMKGTTLRGHIVRGLDDGPDELLFRHIFLDTAQLARIVMAMPDIDETRVSATGGSQGGALTLACAALEPRLYKAASIYPFLSDYYRVWDMDLAENAYEELRAFFRRHDPRHLREQEIFTRLGYIDIQHLAGRIESEVYMGVGLMDKVCPPSTQFAAYNKIRAPKKLEIYPDFAHEQLPDMQDLIYRFITA